MTESLLSELDLTPDIVPNLPGQSRTRLLNFLLRWHATAELIACLDILLEERPDMVSLLDLEARALAADGRYDEALQTMGDRLRLRSSVTAQGLLADIHMAKGDVGTAEAIGQSLIDEDDKSYTGWRLKAEAALARNDLEAAAVANHRLGELRPNGMRYLLDMMDFYQARQDWVTASGYAVRLLNTVETPEELPPVYLEKLLAYFKASGEETRVVEIGEALDARYETELAELKEGLGASGASRTPRLQSESNTPLRSAGGLCKCAGAGRECRRFRRRARQHQ